MTTTDLTRKKVTAGNGVTLTFPFAYPVADTSEVVVQLETIATGVLGPILIEGVDYTVALNPASEGGIVNMTVAPTALENHISARVLPFTMATNIPTVGNVQEPQLEGEFDKRARIDIQVQEQLDRAVLQSIADVGSNFTLPAPVAGKVLGWNPTATDLENQDNNSADAANSATAADASATTAANEASKVIPDFTNKSGGALAIGDLVATSGADDKSVITSTTQADQKVIGGADEAILDNAVGAIRVVGLGKVNMIGVFTRNNFFRQSTTAKRGEDAGATVVTGAIGVLLESGNGVVADCLYFGTPVPDITGLSANDLAAIESAPGTPTGANPFIPTDQLPLSGAADLDFDWIIGRVNAAGTAQDGAGYTSLRNALGQFDITVTGGNFTTVPRIFFLAEGAASQGVCSYDNLAVGGFRVLIRTDAGVALDRDFTFLAIGPK